MIRALPHLLHRARVALHLHFLAGRRAQLLQGIATLEQCIEHDRLLVAQMRAELHLIDTRTRAAQPARSAT